MRKNVTVIMNEDHRICYSGVSRFVREILPRLAPRFQVTLVSTRSDSGIRREQLEPDGRVVQFPMYRLPFPDTYIPRFNGDLGDILKKSDLVFIQTLDLFFPLMAARKLGKPVLLYFHALDWEMLPRTWGLRKTKPLVSGIIRKLWAIGAARASHICLPWPEYARYLVESGVSTPFSWIPPGLDTVRFRPPEDKRMAHQRIGFNEENFVIGFVGRLWPDKNLDLLFDVFRRFHEVHPEARLLMVGSGFERYEQRAQKEPGVLWVGHQTDVVPFYQAMDLFCHFLQPNETSSFATMEAMSCGVPVVVNAIASPRHYVRDGVSGTVIDPPNDRARISGCLEELFEKPELRARMAAQARKAAQKFFNWDQTVSLLSDLIETYTEPPCNESIH